MPACSNRHPAVSNAEFDRPLFPLGNVVATPGALEMLKSLNHSPLDYLFRHWHGDWGNLDTEDQKANQAALRFGYRLMSSYQIDESHRLWIITEAALRFFSMQQKCVERNSTPLLSMRLSIFCQLGG